MSPRGSFDEFQGKATALEKKYEWLEAADVYDLALGTVDEGDFFIGGKIREKIGYCLQRAAFQAESREEFSERLGKAVEAYESAHEFYQMLPDNQGVPWMLRCRAISRDLSHWLASDPSEKRRLLDECLELEEKALAGFWDIGNKLEYSRMYNQLPLVHYNRYILEWDRQVRESILEKAIAWGEKAVSVLSELADPHETARASSTVALYLSFLSRWHVAEPNKQEQHRLKDIERFRRAVELSERVGDTYLVGLAQWNWGLFTSSEESIQHYRKMLACGEETRDIFLKGLAQDHLASGTQWKASATDDPDQRNKLAEEAMEFYDEAQRRASIMSYLFRVVGIILAPGGYAEHYYIRARWETDLEKKLEFLERSENVGLKALKKAEYSDIPTIIDRMCHYLSKTLQSRATLESDVDSKRRLLEKAIKYRERNIEIDERLHPFDYYNLGVWNHYLALIKMEFADIESDLKDKRRLLEESAICMEKCVKSIDKEIPYFDKRGIIYDFASISRFQDNYEVILSRLYDVTNEPEYLRRAIEISRRSIESASRAGMLSRIAESYWKIAKAQVTLGEHLDAAENFERASESYEKAAEKIPQLKKFYQEHASYMSAWSEFEKAKQHHAEKRYVQAKEHYEKAAELHKSAERWSYLAPNYLAWARLEEAEDLSRREETEEARDLFKQASGLFKEAKGSIEIKLGTIREEEESELLVSLVQASDVRREYCLGRKALEEGRILDRQGDHLASSRKYGSAAETFQRIAGTSEEAKKELQPLVCLCNAWQKMTQAEAEASADLYLEASHLFDEAKDHSLDERTKRLTLGHSRFCKALEAGTRFEYTRDHTFYSEALQYLGSAASYYARAGFKRAANYAEATQRLFDAYVYMDNANREIDPQKKTRYYTMAERVLETSAGTFLIAKHPEKSKEVERLLLMVREKRELAASLSEVLHTPTTVSTTEAFTAPSPTKEVAVGLERFENADIQANLILGKGDVKVGDDIDIEIELVNAGKAPAQLIKVEEIIPRGFEVKSAPGICRVEDSYLDMKGRTLNPLKTAELKLVLRPLDKGTYNLRPRVLFLDEAGKYRSHEPEPATVVVKELGIKGWLRGPMR